jgi:hypothetical protein
MQPSFTFTDGVASMGFVEAAYCAHRAATHFGHERALAVRPISLTMGG